MSRYADRVIADAAVAYWRLNESAGPAVDAAGSMDLSVNGSPSYQQAGIMFDGSPNTSIGGWASGNFQTDDASSELIEFAGSLPFSVEAWITDITSALAQIVGRGRGTTTIGQYDGWSMAASHSGGVATVEFGRARTAGGFVEQIVTDGGHDPTDRLHCVATYDGTTLRLYVNGVLVDTDATAVAIDGTVTMLGQIGAGNVNLSPDFEFSGLIDEVAVYDSVLSPATIEAHYALGIAAETTNRIGGSGAIRRGAPRGRGPGGAGPPGRSRGGGQPPSTPPAPPPSEDQSDEDEWIKEIILRDED